jgi:hypothetical protein
MKKWRVFGFIFVIFLLLFVFYVVKGTKSDNEFKQEDLGNIERDSIKVSDLEDSENLDSYTSDEDLYPISNESLDGSFGGGGSISSSSSQSISEGSSYCYEDFISYSLKNFKTEQSCPSLEPQCFNKLVSCSLEVHNLDLIEESNFEINSTLYVLGNIESNKYGSETKSIKVLPRNFTRANFYFEVSGEDANLDFSCSYETLNRPAKLVCI